jgi:hypothetical protein
MLCCFNRYINSSLDIDKHPEFLKNISHFSVFNGIYLQLQPYDSRIEREPKVITDLLSQ